MASPALRRPYRREGEEKRRDDLIAAAMTLVAEGGPEAATVRAIAARAGVTPGLIRHYFQSKEELTHAAYRQVMDAMTHEAIRACEAEPSDDPVARLAAFVAASFRPPVMTPLLVGVWAGYMHLGRNDPVMHEIHESTYLGYRDRLQALIAALPRPADPARDRREAIACNALIDGLWLEGGSLPDGFAPGEVMRIALDGVATLLGIRFPADAYPDLPEGKTD
ncbi:MAG: TetR family transcriptional regulator C-terminal domain-containing protein [Rhodobacteraceae bacterium]|nr:TetR family transcriptional regulator C-terminal domain-containing protein [Paracoccaceae bacterium]